MKTVSLDYTKANVYICCPECRTCESLAVDEQRHHLQTFEILNWGKGEPETSEMQCASCGATFIQMWNY